MHKETDELSAMNPKNVEAIIPVLSFGIRAWFAAFQLPPSASIYEAKNHALIHPLDHLDKVSGNLKRRSTTLPILNDFLRMNIATGCACFRKQNGFL